MQHELADAGIDTLIFGVNDVGFESGNASITEGRDLPWLQNTESVDAWTSWQVVYRDVVVIDPDGSRVAVFNLSSQDLGIDAHYDELLELLSP